ncbi:MAG: hypothetical protein ACXVUX_15215 [Solirubrobacteraceae bacterium]
MIDDFEIINEPDGAWSFYGTPQQYARILAAAYAAIHAANPDARVVLGGLMNVGGHGWLDQVLATPGADALHRFDIANIHVRVPPAQAGAIVAGWRRHLARTGFHGPLWVTETGYPADPTWQTEPGYRDGPAGQARWMATAIPAMLHAGAARVFVTERDSLAGPLRQARASSRARTRSPKTPDSPTAPASSPPALSSGTSSAAVATAGWWPRRCG